ncbi:ArsR/SmtB family transcription factor [Micromonospora zhanjiangensis]|uniref:ArsR/SmtB family transcription factor n=1 Tax=Micromonospora zhanjiangensis TaxID=1522057 RepID=A0ABV8KMH6_9ACTN
MWRALLDAGVTLVPLGADRVELTSSGVGGTSTVVASTAPLNPSDIAALADRHGEPGLIIVPAATPAARAAAEAAGWSWLVDDGHHVVGTLRIGGQRVRLDTATAPTRERPRRVRPGRLPWGTLTLVRRLIERPYATQTELAELTGVSQPRVSQSLRTLSEQGLVRRTSTGWTAADVDRLARWWLDAYPGPGGISTFWFGLEPPVAQARAVVALFDTIAARSETATTRHPSVAVSGDVAADFIAPWHTPSRAIVYARTGSDLAPAGLTPAGADEATLELVVARDPGVWPGERIGDSLPLADPLQILWDVRRSTGADTEEAADRLWQVLRRRTWHTGGGHAA